MRLLGPCACLHTRTVTSHFLNTHSVFCIVPCHKSSGLKDIRIFRIAVITTSASTLFKPPSPGLKSKLMCYLCCMKWDCDSFFSLSLPKFKQLAKCVLRIFYFCHNTTLCTHTYARIRTSLSYMFRQLLSSSGEEGSNFDVCVSVHR